jgi:hypothetical protein
MEQAQMTNDNLRNVMTTVDAMQVANKEMKKQYKNVNLDKLDVCDFIKSKLVHKPIADIELMCFAVTALTRRDGRFDGTSK